MLSEDKTMTKMPTRLRMALTLPLAIVMVQGNDGLRPCTSTTPDWRALTAIGRNAQNTLDKWLALLRPDFPSYEPALGLHAAVHLNKPAGSLLSICGPDMIMPRVKSTTGYNQLKELALTYGLDYLVLDLEKDGTKLKYKATTTHYPFTLPTLSKLSADKACALQMDHPVPSLHIIDNT